jgi:hypothetical protein
MADPAQERVVTLPFKRAACGDLKTCRAARA